MKKLIYIITTLSISSIFHAQVGINNQAPKTTLDVTAKRKTDGTLDGNNQLIGLQAPRLTLSELTSLTSTYGADQKGALVYITDLIGGDTSSPRTNVNAVGYYYWDGSLWQKVTGTSAANDLWVTDITNTMVKLAKQSDGTTARTTGTDFVAKDNGSVGIGTSSPNTSSILDINSSNKGLLIPKVTLTGIADGTTIASPANGLIVYNTTTNANGPGITVNNGTPTAPNWSVLLNYSPTTGGAISAKLKYLGAIDATKVLTIGDVSFRFVQPTGTLPQRYQVQMRVNALPPSFTSVTYRTNRIDFFSTSSNSQEVNLTFNTTEVTNGVWKEISFHSSYTGTHSNLIHISSDEQPIFIRLSTQERFGAFWSMVAELY